MQSPWEDWRARIAAAEPGAIALEDERLAGVTDVPDAIEHARRAIDAFWELLATNPRVALAEALLAHQVAHRCASGLRPALALRHATGLFVLGRSHAAARVLAAELLLHPRETRGANRTRLLALQGKVLLATGEIGAALVSLEEALAMTHDYGPPSAVGSVLSALGNARLLRGDLVSAAEYYGDALEVAKRHDNLEGVAVGLGNRGLVRHVSGRLDAALLDYEAALEQARRNGDRRCALPLSANLGLLATERGDLDAARQHLLVALELARALSDPGSTATCHVRLSALSRERDDLAAARDHLRAADAALREAGDDGRDTAPSPDAEQTARPGFGRVSWWLESGRLALDRRDAAGARAPLERARRCAARLGHVSGEAWARYELARVAHSEGALSGALGALKRLVEDARDLDQPLLRASVLTTRARALLQRGRVEPALDALTLAESLLPPDTPAAARAACVRAQALHPSDPSAAAALRADLRARAHARGWFALLRALEREDGEA